MAEMNLGSQQDILNHYAQLASTDFKLNEPAQVPISYGTQPVDPYLAAQMWSSLGPYPDYTANVYGAFLQGTPATTVPANLVVSDAIASQAAVMFNHDASNASHVSRPSASPHAPTQDMTHHPRMAAANVPSSPKDVVDETEDLAIEQSLKDFENMEMESQHSYASALNTGEFFLACTLSVLRREEGWGRLLYQRGVGAGRGYAKFPSRIEGEE